MQVNEEPKKLVEGRERRLNEIAMVGQMQKSHLHHRLHEGLGAEKGFRKRPRLHEARRDEKRVSVLRVHLPKPSCFPHLFDKVNELLLANRIFRVFTNELKGVLHEHPRCYVPFLPFEKPSLAHDDKARHQTFIFHIHHPVERLWHDRSMLHVRDHVTEEQEGVGLCLAHLRQVLEKAVPCPAARLLRSTGRNHRSLQRCELDNARSWLRDEESCQCLDVVLRGHVLKVHELQDKLQVLDGEGAAVAGVQVAEDLADLQVVALHPVIHGDEDVAAARLSVAHG
mmetsp:Transcript_33107/g.77241  ORF Transcript_33107/g.77241 Transcript_33107/m.77241 type:complete len:283 (-) Transcript_33107:1016-1864(-)